MDRKERDSCDFANMMAKCRKNVRRSYELVVMVEQILIVGLQEKPR
jgi:hypothetical protein